MWSLPDAFVVVAGSEQRITFRKTDPLLTLLAFDTICWKVAPVRPKDASIDIISQRFKFLDFLGFQLSDSDTFSSFLPSHSEGA